MTLSIFSCAYWQFEFLLWRDVYLGPLPIFSTGLFVLLFLLSCMSKPQFKTSSLQKAMAPHSSTLAWKIPWTEEPGRLHSMGSLRVRHDRVTSLSLFTFMHWRRKWQPTPLFLLGESQGWGSLVGCRLWDRTESDTTEATQQQHILFLFPRHKKFLL